MRRCTPPAARAGFPRRRGALPSGRPAGRCRPAPRRGGRAPGGRSPGRLCRCARRSRRGPRRRTRCLRRRTCGRRIPAHAGARPRSRRAGSRGRCGAAHPAMRRAVARPAGPDRPESGAGSVATALAQRRIAGEGVDVALLDPVETQTEEQVLADQRVRFHARQRYPRRSHQRLTEAARLTVMPRPSEPSPYVEFDRRQWRALVCRRHSR